MNAWAVEFLSSIIAFRTFRPEVDLPFNEQSAQEHMQIDPRFRKHHITVPQRWFNAYQPRGGESDAVESIRAGDFLLHFPGHAGQEDAMQEWLDRREEHPSDWDVDYRFVSHTAIAEHNHLWCLSDFLMSDWDQLDHLSI